jgi:hypothetical protein
VAPFQWGAHSKRSEKNAQAVTNTESHA